MASPVPPTPVPGYKDQFARLLVRNQVEKELQLVKDWSKLDDRFVDPTHTTNLGFPAKSSTHGTPTPEDLKVCIIGAGVAGLYTSLILTSLGIEHDILEASNRVGGRILTYKFSSDPHDYYDIGAMRFPNTPVMTRTFNLFKLMGVDKNLIPYHMSGETNPLRYNDVTIFGKDEEQETPDGPLKDPFKVSVSNGGPVPNESVRDPDSILNDAYDWFRTKIKRDPAKGFEYLFNHDKFSLRDYLQFVEFLDPETIDWLETRSSGTGWFNQAMTENILESLDFDYYHKENADGSSEEEPNPWWCVEGGTEVLTQAMYKKLQEQRQQIQLNSQVYKITQDKDENSQLLTVYWKTGADKEATTSKKYGTVFNTTTFMALQKMDLTDLAIPYAAKTSIRSLRYETSTKVAIKFKSNWWVQKFGQTEAGLGKTDMPLRTCVYPSYNIGDKGNCVLLCSYTWGLDSERVASLVKEKSPQGEEQLKDLMLDNLARLHTKTEAEYESLLKDLEADYMTHHAFDWSKDTYSSGAAFALFGPAQFQKLYGTLTKPMLDGRFHIIGEAASAHHAWVVGALDSAVRGVHLFLERFWQDDRQAKLKSDWEPTGELDYETDYLQVALGMLKGGPPTVDSAVENLSKQFRKERE